MAVRIVKKHCTGFKRYGQRREGALDSMQVHSIGAAQNTAEAIRQSMNQYSPPGIVHAVVDAEKEGYVVELLPDDNVAWADAGYGNRHSYTFEIAESDSMKYRPNSAEYTVTDEQRFLADIRRGYRNAAAFAAQKCVQLGLNPLGRLQNGLYVLYSHDEGRRAGVSSGHVDPTHIWGRIQKTMDDFRAEVAAAMKAGEEPEPDGRSYVVQTGSYSIRANADRQTEAVRAAGFEAFIKKKGGLYNVQTGSFTVRGNAERLASELEKAGFEAIIK